MRRLALLVVLAISLTGAAVAFAAGTSSGSGWSLAAQFSHVTLDGVSCQSASSCNAVGFLARSPTAGLGKAVSAEITPAHPDYAPSTQLVPVPHGAVYSALNGASCVSGVCLAVGAYTHLVRGQLRIGSLAVMSRSGGPWQLMHDPAPGSGQFPSSELIAVSCSTAHSCVAVGRAGAPGFNHYPLMVTYHGQKANWRHVPLYPGGHVFNYRTLDYGGVSCPAANSCMVVGTYNPPGNPMSAAFSVRFLHHWHVGIGTPAPEDVMVGGVSCSSSAHCVEVGQYGKRGPEQPFLLQSHAYVRTYNGAWGPMQALPLPAGATGAVLTDVKCPGQGSCVAVGAATRNGVPVAPLAYSLQNGAWSMQTPPTSHPSQHPYLNSVSCPTSTSCVALGLYSSMAGSFIERLG